MDVVAEQGQSPVFRAMMARASMASKASEAPPAPPPVKANKRVSFATASPKPYTPTRSSPKADKSIPPMDMGSYLPMIVSAVVLGGTYFMTGSSQRPPQQTRQEPVVIPGLGVF